MKAFGDTIAAARKKLGMSQRELAAKILKEDGLPISVQYLNDIEHGRRNPPSSEHLMAQLARALNLPKNQLMVQAGYLPSDIMQPIRDLIQKQPDKAETVLRAFRKKLDDLNK
jgi:transcriptional regulator with XRE-family HTH domain